MTHWTERLSEYLDGTLSGAERLDCERHLADCAECTATLDELRRVVARAHALENRTLRADLWTGIAARIGVSRPGVTSLTEHRARRRIAFTLPQLAAASIALVLLSAGSAWLALAPRSHAGPASVLAAGDAGAFRLAEYTKARAVQYDLQVAELQQELDANRGHLDTATVRVIEKNLAIIDGAITEARRALASDTASAYLNLHLADTMRRKLQLLRTATSLARAQS